MNSETYSHVFSVKNVDVMALYTPNPRPRSRRLSSTEFQIVIEAEGFPKPICLRIGPDNLRILASQVKEQLEESD